MWWEAVATGKTVKTFFKITLLGVLEDSIFAYSLEKLQAVSNNSIKIKLNPDIRPEYS